MSAICREFYACQVFFLFFFCSGVIVLICPFRISVPSSVLGPCATTRLTSGCLSIFSTAATRSTSTLLVGMSTFWQKKKKRKKKPLMMREMRVWMKRPLVQLKWRLFIKMATDWQVSEVGDTCRPAAGPGSRRSLQIEWISAETAHLGFPALLSVPHLLSREIMMNRRHYSVWSSCFDIA